MRRGLGLRERGRHTLGRLRREDGPPDDGLDTAALLQRVADLEARLSVPDWRVAPALWQDVGRPPLASVGNVLANVAALAGPDADAQGALLAERAVSGAIGAHAALPVLADLDPARLRELAGADAAELPASGDRVGYFGEDHVAYWLSGLSDALFIGRLSEQYGRPLERGCAFLDFGCASGRVLRHMERAHPEVTIWGVDLSTAPLSWARENLPPRIRLVQGTMVPSLPLPDDAIDVVFAGSVFTHVREFEESLLFELARVVRPGGLLLLSVHPERAWLNLGSGEDPALADILTAVPHRAEPMGIEPVTLDLFREPMPADRVVVTNTSYPINNHFTFHKRAWIERHWGAHLELVDVIERGHGRRQDLVVLRA